VRGAERHVVDASNEQFTGDGLGTQTPSANRLFLAAIVA
jgi:hypothetical protein